MKKVKKVIIYAPLKTLKQIKNSRNIIKKTHFLLNSNVILRLFWQIFFLKKICIEEKVNCLFVTCGYYFMNFKPTVIIPQNFLPFDEKSINDYRFSFQYIRIYLLKLFLVSSLKKADGIIFLSNFLKNFIKKKIKFKTKRIDVIPHGVEKINIKNSFKNYNEIIYVSDFEKYKNHIQLFEAIKILSNKYRVKLTCIGDIKKTDELKIVMKKFKLNNNINIEFKNRLKRKNFYHFVSKKIFLYLIQHVKILR